MEEQNEIASASLMSQVKRATRFARSRPKTSLALVAGVGILFLPRLTALAMVGAGGAWWYSNKASDQTRRLVRERSMSVISRAKQLLPEKVVVVPTVPMEERVHAHG